MKTIRIYFAFIFLAFAIASCNKDGTGSVTGTYVSTFTVTYPTHTATGNATVKLHRNGQFNCSRDTNNIPAGGSGTFTKTADKMAFKDINYWTADFDWNLILNGEYNFSLDGKNLKLIAFKNDYAQYEYDLTRQ